MNIEELRFARQKYANLNEQRREEEEQLEKELEGLRKDPNVKKYIELSKYKDEETKKTVNDKILADSFNYVALNTKDSCNLFVFFGFYSTDSGLEKSVPLSSKNSYARYKYFVNLETCDVNIIPLNDSKNFEKENKIIYFDDINIYHNKGFYIENFFKLRNSFFEELINNTQEEVVKQLIKKR